MKKPVLLFVAMVAGLILLLVVFNHNNQVSAAGFSLSSPYVSATVIQPGQSQGSGDLNGAEPVAPDAYPYGRMSYQGQLLFNGVPFNGSINLTFRLYPVPTGGAAIWSEIQSVSMTNGVFNVMLGAVNPMNMLSNNLSSQAWLGIQPAGAASELTPRQLLGATAYAYGLMPGATMVDNNSAGDYIYSFWVNSINHSAIYAGTSQEDGVALDANSTGTNGTGSGFPVAVKASTTSANTASVYASNTGGGTCSGTEIFCPAALVAASTNGAYGARLYTNQKPLIFGRNTGSGFWDIFVQNTSSSGGIYTNSDMYVGDDLMVVGAKSGYVVDIALNDDHQPLERGDVVAISGYADPVLGEIPVIRVQKASLDTAAAVVGIVDKLYLPCDKDLEELQTGERCGGFVDSMTIIEPSQYLAVVTLGAYGYLKVDAAAGPIQPGDLLSLSRVAGFAAPAEKVSVQGVSFYAPGTIIGKALGSPKPGSSYIPVFVTIR